MKYQQSVDVVIVGGGPAGLTAALFLGRSLKSVLVIDRGHPRHAVSDGVHNFLTRDGMPPAEFRAEAWSQMATYPSVSKLEDTVRRVESVDGKWRVWTAEHDVVECKALLLATGVIDEHPTIAGYDSRWGTSIHHCPYCHGWELRNLPLAVLATGESAIHMAPLLRGWSDDVIVVTHGAPMDTEHIEQLNALGIDVYLEPIVSLDGPGRSLSTIHLEGGEVLQRQGLFVRAPQHQVGLIQSLDLEYDEHGYVATDGFQQTGLPGLWVAGDATTMMQQVVGAASQGAIAGATINGWLTLART